MRIFRRQPDVEAQLRSRRAEANPAFVDGIASKLAGARGRRQGLRLATAGALTLAALVLAGAAGAFSAPAPLGHVLRSPVVLFHKVGLGHKAKKKKTATPTLTNAAFTSAALSPAATQFCDAKVNMQWHYATPTTSGSFSAPKTVSCPEGTISFDQQAMEGDLKVEPGTTLLGGYQFTTPGNNTPRSATVSNAVLTFTQVHCVNGSTASPGTFTLPLPTQAYSVTASENAPGFVYQGSIPVPDVCGGTTVRLDKGAFFTANVRVIPP